MKKGLKITLIVVISLIIVLGAGTAIVMATQGDYVKNKFAMATKDDKEYFQWVADKNVEKTSDGLTKVSTAVKTAEASAVTADTTLLVSVSKEFGELIGSKTPFEINKAGFRFNSVTEGYNKSEIALTPIYNGVDILKFVTLVDMDSKEMLMSVPTYKSDIIDFSEVFTNDLSALIGQDKLNELKEKAGGLFGLAGDDKTDIYSMIQQFTDELKEKAESTGSEDTAAEIDEFMQVIYDNLGEVTLEKDQKITVNNLETECNTLNFTISKDVLFKLFKEFMNKATDSVSALDTKTADSFSTLSTQLDSIFESEQVKNLNLSINCALYVNNKGEFIGGFLKPEFNGTKLKIDFLTVDSEDDKNNTEAELSLNGLKIGTLSCSSSVDGDGASIGEYVLRPGALISTYIGNKKYAVKINTRLFSNEKSTDNELTLSFVDEASATDLIKLEITGKAEYGVAEFSLDRSKNNVIAYKDLGTSDYVDLKAIVQFAIDKLKEINDDSLNGLLSSGIMSILNANGLSADMSNLDIIETLQQLIDSGYLDMLGNQIGQDSSLTSDQSFNSLDAAGVVSGDDDGIQDIPDNDETIGENPDALEAGSEMVNVGSPVQNENGEYIYSYDFLKDVVASLDYKGIVVSAEDAAVDLDTARELYLSELSDYGSYFPAEAGETIEIGDMITFDAAAVLAGLPLDDYSYTDLNALIGNYEYGEGIDDQLVGMAVGDSIDLTLTLGSEYGMFSGYNGDFRITVTGIDKWVQPEWTTEYIVGRLGYESLQECDEYVAQTYMSASSDEEGLRLMAYDSVWENASYNDISESIRNRFIAWQDDFYQATVGMNIREYFDYYNDMIAILDESVSSDCSFEENMEIQIWDCAVNAYIADAEGITVTAEELEAEYASMAEEYQLSVDAIKGFEPEWVKINTIIEKKVMDVVYSYAVIE